MKIHTAAHRIKTLSQFTKVLEKQFDVDDVLFRGQPQDSPLLPRIARLKIEDPILEAERKMFDGFKLQVLPFLQFQSVGMISRSGSL